MSNRVATAAGATVPDCSIHSAIGAIATRIEPFKGFYAAEGYHQNYLVLNPTQPYIVYNDLPKVAALKRVWPQYWQEKPVLLARS